MASKALPICAPNALSLARWLRILQLFVIGCSSAPNVTTSQGTAGSGGWTSTSGTIATGGTPTQGGIHTDIGGTHATGGAVAAGGATATSGTQSGSHGDTGGAVATGGVNGQGGTSNDAGERLSIELQLGAEDAGAQLTQLIAARTGEIYAIAWTHGNIDPEGPFGLIDAVIVKLNADGSRAWVRQFGELGTVGPGIVVKAWDAALTPDGELVLTGLVNGRGQFRGQPLAIAYNAFVAAFSAQTGEEHWVRVLSGTDGTTEAMGIETLPDGTIAIAGATSAYVLAEQPSLGNMDVFLAWISRKGEVLRVQRYGGADEEYPTAFGSRADWLFFARKAGSTLTGTTTALELVSVDATGSIAHRTSIQAPERTDVVGFSPTNAGLCATFRGYTTAT